MVGTRLGPYTLLEELGRGGMATVYRAHQASVDRDVAVKVIHRAITFDPVAVQRFTSEARMIARLEHPHILPVYDFAGDHDPPYIVMRYLPTGTLKEIMERTHLPIGEALHIFRQIGSALDYAHRQGVVHRDVKPSNVMIDEDANVFISDFGIARLVEGGDGLTGTGIAIGTPGYMAPEQGMGREIDGRADIYSLGVMLYEIITGQPPYTAPTPMAVVLKHINDPIPQVRMANPELPDAIQPIVEKALAKKPEERYQTATDMMADFSGAVGPDVQTRPVELRRAAGETISEMRRARAEAMEKPTASAAPEMGHVTPTPHSSPGPMADAPTITPSSGQMAHPQARQGGGRMTLIVAGIVGLLLVGAIIGGIVLLGGGDDGSDGGGDKQSDGTGVVVAEASETDTRTPEPTDEATGTATATATETGLGVAAEASETVTEESSPEATETPSRTPTDVPSDTPTYTRTPTLTQTPSQTPSETPSRTPTDTLTPTPSIPQGVITATTTQVRLGPGEEYPQVAFLTFDAEVEITEISRDGLWVRVVYEEAGGQGSGFVLTRDVRVTGGRLAGLPRASYPTLTLTPTRTPSTTPSLTPTQTPSNTPSPTATDTPSPTSSHTPTATHTESPTPQLPTNTPTPTPPPPAGRMPYLADMEMPDQLEGWSFRSEDWQIVPEAGNKVLVGTSGLNRALEILGAEAETPEWKEAGATDIILRYKFSLNDPGNSGSRVIFRFSEDGYYVIDAVAGLLTLKRGRAGGEISRSTEINLASFSEIQAGVLHEVIVWSEGRRIYVYVDNELVITVNDSSTLLPAGGILLQTLSTADFAATVYDDIIIQKAEAPSSHFENISGFPSDTWNRSSNEDVMLGNNGLTSYIALEGEASVQPTMPDMSDFLFSCNIRSQQGDYYIRLRDQGSAALLFEGKGGNLVVSSLNSQGRVEKTETLQNFYSRDFNNMIVQVAGNRVIVYDRNGNREMDEIFDTLPESGRFVFGTGGSNDILHIDDCIFAGTTLSSTSEAEFAFEILNELQNRPVLELSTDFTEDFSDVFRTREWWEGAEGEYVLDEEVPVGDSHRRYFILQSDGNNLTYRSINTAIDQRTLFGRGSDSANFSDSTDVYVQVSIRIPVDAPTNSTGWVGVRAEPDAIGVGFNQYQLEVSLDPSGQIRVRVRPFLENDKSYVYDELLENVSMGDWVEIEIVADEDRIAFFANKQFLTTIRPATQLGGTVTIGVNGNSEAHFDDLQIRDISVNQ
jgi:serine/threonine protein kinase/uncharacterized protein YraI